MADNKEPKIPPPNEDIGGETSPDVQRVALVSSSPSVRSIVRVVLIVLLLLAAKDILVYTLTSLTYLLFMVVLAVLLAYLINPLVKAIHKPFEQGRLAGTMPRAVAIVFAFILVFGVLAVGIGLLSPVVSEQAKTFVSNIPNYTEALNAGIYDFNRRLDSLGVSDTIQTQINERINGAIDNIGTGVTTFFGAAAVFVVTFLPWLLLIPILSFFFLKDAQFFRLVLLRIFPVGEWRLRVDSILDDINDTLAAYTRAQLIACIWIGVVCTIGFYILGNKYALLLGVLAGIFEFVPIIGPLATAFIATVVAGLESPLNAALTALFLAVLRVLQDYAIYPRIVREGIKMHPLAIILSVLAGEQIAGIPGVFVALPLVALGTVLHRHFLAYTDSRGIITDLLEEEPKTEATPK